VTEIVAASIIALTLILLRHLQHKDYKRMSQSFDNLTAAVADLGLKADAAVAALKNPPSGTPDSALDGLTTTVQGIAANLAAATPAPAA